MADRTKFGRRMTVYVDPPVRAIVERESQSNGRTISAQVEWMLIEWEAVQRLLNSGIMIDHQTLEQMRRSLKNEFTADN